MANEKELKIANEENEIGNECCKWTGNKKGL